MASTVTSITNTIDVDFPPLGENIVSVEPFLSNFRKINKSLDVISEEVTLLEKNLISKNKQNDFGYNIIQNIKLLEHSYKVNNLGGLTNGTTDIYYNQGSYVTAFVESGFYTLNIKNWPPNNTLGKIRIQVINSSITDSVVCNLNFAGNSTYLNYFRQEKFTISANQSLFFDVWTLDNGDNIYVKQLGVQSQTQVNYTPSIAQEISLGWTYRNSSVNQMLYDISYGSGIWAAVGQAGSVITSSDGVTWTSRSSNTSTNFNAVYATTTTFVAVGDGGTIRVSTGTNWTNGTTFVGEIFNDVYFYNNQWVTVGNNGIIRVSTDTVVWNKSFPPITIPSDINLRGITYGYSKAIVVGNKGFVISYSDTNVWQNYIVSINSNVDNMDFESIDWNGNIFAAVTRQGLILTSYDGTENSWNTVYNIQNHPLGEQVALYGIKWSGSEWVATGSISSSVYANSRAFILVSTNSENWSEQSIPQSNHTNYTPATYTFELRKAFNNGSAWVAVGGNSTYNTDQILTTNASLPAITSISPSLWDSNGGTSVTITGINFTNNPKVLIDGVEISASSYTVVNTTQITLTTLNGPGGTSSLVQVLNNSGTGNGVSIIWYNQNTYQYSSSDNSNSDVQSGW